MSEIVHPVEVASVGGYRLWLRFEDGLEGEIDLAGFRRNGVFEPFEDLAFFQEVDMDHEIGTIAWPNGADIAPETLHLWVLEGEYPYPD